jgi:hypothetical protein
MVSSIERFFTRKEKGIQCNKFKHQALSSQTVENSLPPSYAASPDSESDKKEEKNKNPKNHSQYLQPSKSQRTHGGGVWTEHSRWQLWSDCTHRHRDDTQVNQQRGKSRPRFGVPQPTSLHHTTPVHQRGGFG